MDYNDTYEREIDLKELMFAVLHKWRMILICALFFAVLLGGYKAVSAYRSQNSAEALEAAEESYSRDLEIYNKSMEACKREIDNLNQHIASQQEYLENSILMNMSPYDIWEAKAELFIKTDNRAEDEDSDFTSTIMRAYQSVLTNGELLSAIAADMGVDERYIQELVTVGWDSYYLNDNLFSIENKNGSSVISRMNFTENNLLTVQVRHEDEEKAKELLSRILEGADQFQEQIRSNIGPYTISEISTSVSSRVDFALADWQNEERLRMERLKESLKNKTDELNNIKGPEGAVSPISSGIKYGAIGGVLGAFAVVFFVCIGFVMSDKVYSAKELKYRFKIKILGILPAGTKNTGKIDTWLNHLEGRVQNVDKEHEFALISANICNYMEEVHSLLVIGSAQEETVSLVASELADRLPGVKVTLGGNVLHNAEGLRRLPECDGIVLVERCGESLYSEVESEIEKACDLQKSVIGCVVFE